MRKIGWVLSIFILVGLFLAGNVFAQDAILTISSLQGKVLVKKADSKDWIEAKPGDMLNKGDTVKTLEDGVAYLEYSPGTGFSISPNSQLVITDIVKAPPLVAEPYSEPAGPAGNVNSVVAPEANQDSSASRI